MRIEPDQPNRDASPSDAELRAIMREMELRLAAKSTSAAREHLLQAAVAADRSALLAAASAACYQHQDSTAARAARILTSESANDAETAASDLIEYDLQHGTIPVEPAGREYVRAEYLRGRRRPRPQKRGGGGRDRVRG